MMPKDMCSSNRAMMEAPKYAWMESAAGSSSKNIGSRPCRYSSSRPMMPVMAWGLSNSGLDCDKREMRPPTAPLANAMVIPHFGCSTFACARMSGGVLASAVRIENPQYVLYPPIPRNTNAKFIGGLACAQQ